MVATDTFDCTARSRWLNLSSRMRPVMASATATQSSDTNSSALSFGAQASGLPHSAPCRRRPAGPSGWPGADTVLTTREDVMTELRFGIVSESVRTGRAWLDYARQIEDAGIGVLL